MSEMFDLFALADDKKKKITKKEQNAEDRKKNFKKNEKKVQTFDEQYEKSKGTPSQKVIDHLLALGMREKMEHPDVSVAGMWAYIKSEAQKQAKNGCAVIDDDVVYGWGRHYYDEHGKVA